MYALDSVALKVNPWPLAQVACLAGSRVDDDVFDSQVKLNERIKSAPTIPAVSLMALFLPDSVAVPRPLCLPPAPALSKARRGIPAKSSFGNGCVGAPLLMR